MIPKRLFWLLDLFAAFVAFAVAYAVWPPLRTFFFKLAVKEPSWVPAILRPSVDGPPLAPFFGVAWMLLILAPALVVFLAILDAHTLLLAQSRTKIIGTAALSATASTAILTMALFAYRRLDGSRLLIFSFAVIGAGAVASLRLYFELRRDAGCYAKNVVLVGPRPIVTLLIAHLRANVTSMRQKTCMLNHQADLAQSCRHCSPSQHLHVTGCGKDAWFGDSSAQIPLFSTAWGH